MDYRVPEKIFKYQHHSFTCKTKSQNGQNYNLLLQITYKKEVVYPIKCKTSKRSIQYFRKKAMEECQSLFHNNRFKKYYKYYDPSPNFDRSKEKGLLPHLVNVKQPDRPCHRSCSHWFVLSLSCKAFFLLPF